MRIAAFLILSGLTLAACGGGAAAPAPGAPSAAQSASSAPSKPAASTSAAASAKPAASASAKPAASGLATLKVAHVASTLFAPLYIAIDKGYMQQQGVNADLTSVTAGQDAQAFLANGQLDVSV